MTEAIEDFGEYALGKEREKHTFLVLKQDAELEYDMAKANEIEERWKRREAWRSLAGRIAKISVSVYAKLEFNPESIAREYLGQFILEDDFYSSEQGLILNENYEII